MTQRDRGRGQPGRASGQIPQRRSAGVNPNQYTEEPVRQRAPVTNDLYAEPRRGRGLRNFIILLVVVGLLIFLIIKVVIPQIGESIYAWQHADDTLLFKTTAVVGHDDSPTHPTLFLVLGANNYVLVNEYPGGDMSKQRPVFGASLFGNEPPGTLGVTISFNDENGDHIPDMQIHFGPDGQVIHLLNNPTKKDFELPKS